MAVLKFAVIVNNFTSERVKALDTVKFNKCIVVHGWAEDNGSLAQNAPFLNAASTKNFLTEKDPVSQFPKLERILIEKRLICHLPCVDLSW